MNTLSFAGHPLVRTALPLLLAASLWHGTAAAQGHRHHHDFAADVDAFHAVLAPIWHSRPGKARSGEACAQAGKMANLAADIRSTDATALGKAVAALQKQCKRKPARIDGVLHDVHEAFHALIDAPPRAN